MADSACLTVSLRGDAAPESAGRPCPMAFARGSPLCPSHHSIRTLLHHLRMKAISSLALAGLLATSALAAPSPKLPSIRNPRIARPKVSDYRVHAAENAIVANSTTTTPIVSAPKRNVWISLTDAEAAGEFTRPGCRPRASVLAILCSSKLRFPFIQMSFHSSMTRSSSTLPHRPTLGREQLRVRPARGFG